MNAITDLFSWGIYICTHTTVSICISVKLPIPVDTLNHSLALCGPLAGCWAQWKNGMWPLADDTDSRGDGPVNTLPYPAARRPDPVRMRAAPLGVLCMIIGNVSGESIGPSHLGVISMI